jgi:uncharacterized protein (UPF0212 family)
MKSKTSKRYFYCRHCGNRFDSYYMAEICFDLDMQILNTDLSEHKKEVKSIMKQKTK